MKRSLHVLLAVLLLAAQTANLAHQHAADALSGDEPARLCDFCTGYQTAAPGRADAPAPPSAHFEPARPDVVNLVPLPARRIAAHGSRAPPAIRSV